MLLSFEDGPFLVALRTRVSVHTKVTRQRNSTVSLHPVRYRNFSANRTTAVKAENEMLLGTLNKPHFHKKS